MHQILPHLVDNNKMSRFKFILSYSNQKMKWYEQNRKYRNFGMWMLTSQAGHKQVILTLQTQLNSKLTEWAKLMNSFWKFWKMEFWTFSSFYSPFHTSCASYWLGFLSSTVIRFARVWFENGHFWGMLQIKISQSCAFILKSRYWRKP